MSTLNTQPLASLLKKLFADAEKTSDSLRRGMAGAASGGPPAMPDADNYIEFYTKLKDVHIPVSPQTGTLLYMLARAMGAHSVVEFGTSFGISTLHLAAAVKDNGGGQVISTEFEPSKVAKARANLEAGGVASFVDIREGDALQTLARDLPDSIDLVLLDGAKPLYIKVLALLEPNLRKGALVVADNADLCVDYVAYIRAATDKYVSVPFGADVELSMAV